MLFFLKSLGKIDKLLLSPLPCVTQSSHFLSSQMTLSGFLRILSHENAVARCHHLVTPNLCCLINPLSAASSHISAAAFPEKWMSLKMNIQSVCWHLTASENYFLQLEPSLCFASFSLNCGVEKEGKEKVDKAGWNKHTKSLFIKGFWWMRKETREKNTGKGASERWFLWVVWDWGRNKLI